MKQRLIHVPPVKRIPSKTKKYIISPYNEGIYRYLNFFSDDPALLTCALVQNPLGKTNQLGNLRSVFGKEVHCHLQVLNRLWTQDENILKHYPRYKPVILLYLANFKILFEKLKRREIEQYFPPKTIRYALKLLEKNDITEIRTDLEDHFFSLLEPDVYRNYFSLLKFTKRKFQQRQKEILQSFHKLMEQSHIKAIIEGRVKTIYSIHNKILKKNILFSQILDTIGIRILVSDEENCYRCMASVLKHYPIMTSRIKDYIAVPKDNGYKSIHLTIFYENFPVEIQIRTYDMHTHAQYGKAAHAEYKKNATN